MPGTYACDSHDRVVGPTNDEPRLAFGYAAPITAEGATTRQRIVEGAATLIPNGRTDLLRAVAAHEADQVLADQQPLLSDLTTWRKWQAWRRRVIEKHDAQRGDGGALGTRS